MQSQSMLCALVSIKIKLTHPLGLCVFVLEFTQIIENLDQKVSTSVQLPLEQFRVTPI